MHGNFKEIDTVKYLTVFEDGTFEQVDSYDDSDLKNVSDGYLEILKFENEMFWCMKYDGSTVVWEKI